MQLDAPIIIIGAGRSGSTLLDRMLDAHPEILMFGETDFLAPELFTSLLKGRRKWLIGNDGIESALQELRRLGRLTCSTFADLFKIGECSRTHWGIKEIWNGDKVAIDWAIYDLVFPRAIWVHLVRNPINYARSAIAWSRTSLTEKALTVQFQSWARMVDVSRERRSTGRYVEIRYEDLIDSPELALSPLLEMIGLDYSPQCAEALKERWMPSSTLPDVPSTELVASVINVLQIGGMLEELGYVEFVPEMGQGEMISQVSSRQSGSSFFDLHYQFGMPLADGSRSGNFLILEGGQIESKGGRSLAYWAPLLVGESDSAISPQRSPYGMMEDETLVGPAHANHESIRDTGQGCWSHWGQFIFFSSSDGTDPRTNGRKYALVKLLQSCNAAGGGA